MKLFLRSIVFFTIAIFSTNSFGQLVDWTNQGPDDSWDNGQNWTTTTDTGTIPNASASAHIFPGFITTADPGTNTITVGDGGPTTITITSSNNQSAGSLLVSSVFTGTTETGGVLNLSFNGGSTLTVGALGDMVVTGGSTVNFSGNLQMVSGASLDIGTISSSIDQGLVSGPGTLNLGSGTVNLDNATGSAFIIGLGTTGSVTQGNGSVVTTGEGVNGGLIIGSTGGTGSYTAASGSILNLGDQLAPQSVDYTASVGGATGSVGTLTIASGAVLNGQNPGTTLEVGNIGTGTVIQGGTVNLAGAGTALTVGNGGGTGTYQLTGGTLNIGVNGVDDVAVDIGESAGSTGTLTQSGGTLVAGAATTVVIGDLGTGSYSLSGGAGVTADFQNGLVLGNQAGSVGTITQSGGTLTAENFVVVGFGGSGIYNMQGGTATFNGSVFVSGTGSVNQTGGVFVIPTGQVLDLATAGSSYTLGGTGILQISDAGGGGLLGTQAGGTLNFAGGTLQVTSAGAFSDPFNGTLSGTSTIDDTVTGATASTVTLSGNLSGSGGITFLGGAGSTFQFAGNNSYRGATTITSGILDATADQISSSSSLNVGAAGTFNLTLDAGGLAYAGFLNGPGALNVIYTTAGDTLAVKGTNNFTGPITLGSALAPGNLQVYNGTFGAITGFTGGGTSSGVTIGGPLAPGITNPTTPPPLFTPPTSGTVIFTQAELYPGATTIDSGFKLFATNGTLTGASLGGPVMNSGTLGLTTNTPVGSTFAINGDFTQTTTGVFDVRASGANADLYTATTAELAGKVFVSGTASATPQTFTIVTAGAPITNNGLTTLSGFLLGTSLQFIGNNVDLTVTANPIVGQTPNQNAVAATLNANTNNPIFANINSNLSLTAADAPSILESLTPESLQYARNIAFENSTFLVQRMDSVCADLRGGYGGLDSNAVSVVTPGFESGLGRSLGSMLASNDPAFHSSAPNGVNYYPGGQSSGTPSSSTSEPPTWNSSSEIMSDSAPNPYLATVNPAGPETPPLSEFIGGDAVLAELNQNQSGANAPSSKAKYTAGDATAGVSFRVTNHFAAGVLFNYDHTDATTDSNGSKTKIDTYSPGIFATYFDHGFYANGLASFGYNNYSNTRSIPFLGRTASSSPSGEQYVGNLDLGYDFHPDKAWVVGPTVGVTYTHLDVDSFTETGAAPADLSVNSQSADSLRSRLGGHLIYQTNTGDILLRPNITAMWQHEYLDSSAGITSSFSDFSANPFTIQTAAPSRDSALIGCGLTASLSNSMEFYLNYLADVGADDYWAQSVIGGFKARF